MIRADETTKCPPHFFGITIENRCDVERCIKCGEVKTHKFQRELAPVAVKNLGIRVEKERLTYVDVALKNMAKRWHGCRLYKSCLECPSEIDKDGNCARYSMDRKRLLRIAV